MPTVHNNDVIVSWINSSFTRATLC